MESRRESSESRPLERETSISRETISRWLSASLSDFADVLAGGPPPPTDRVEPMTSFFSVPIDLSNSNTRRRRSEKQD